MAKLKLLLARPRLLSAILAVAVLGTAGFLNNIAIKAQVGSTTAVVAIAQTPTTTPTNAEIDAAVRQAIALAGGLPSNVGPGKKIVIQPNLVQAGHPIGDGCVTHPQVIRTIIAMCLEAGATAGNITVCEGAASHMEGTEGSWPCRQATQKAFRDCGLDAVAPYMVEDTYGVPMADANDVGTGACYPNYPGYAGSYNTAKVTRVIKPGLLINRAYWLPNTVVNCDVLIRVPVLKNHNLAGVTGAMKLAFGFAPLDIYHYPGLCCYKWALLHQTSWGYNELETNARGMCDMTICRPPDLIVTDGLVGVMNGPCGGPDGGGSGGGWTVLPPGGKMRCILASKDPVAVDTIHALLCGYQVSSILGLQRAYEAGLGTNNPGRIEVRGVPVAEARRTFSAWGCAVPDPDRTGPTLADINVPSGTYICGGLIVKPTSPPTDSGSGVCKAELRVDGVLVDSNNSDYSGLWLPTGESDGPHTLKYTIYDKMLNETSITRSVILRKGDPIKSAFEIDDGTGMWIGPVVYTGTGLALDDNTFFVSSASGIPALRVVYDTTTPSVSPGRRMFLYGAMAVADGSRRLNCSSIALYDSVTPVKPRLMTNRALGGASLNALTPGVHLGSGAYNIAGLAAVAGIVSVGGSDYFYVDDGSLSSDPGGVLKLKVKCGACSQPDPGAFVVVTGWSHTELNGGFARRVLVVRSAEDIVGLK